MAWPLAGIELRVADLEGQRDLYQRLLGLEIRDEQPQAVTLGPPDGTYRIRLRHDGGAVERPRPSIGLFHVALRLPDRAALARALSHLEQAGIPLEGASDHGVSEALYLSDAEGNGIELYRDRPREAWPTRGEDVAMTTDPLDVGDLRSEASRAAPPAEGTVLGHIHLHVPDLDEAERFFVDGLGLAVRQRDYPGARFLAVDGYHHHVGVNTWARGRRAPDEAVGLDGYTWLGDPERVAEGLREAGWTPETTPEGLAVEDPAGLRLRVERG